MNTMPKATLDARALLSSLGVATALLASACSPDARTASELPNPSFDTVTAVVSARIGDTGMVDEVDEYIFGDIQSVTADDNGLIYVADRLPPSVRVYRPDGEFLAWVGTGGRGSGRVPLAGRSPGRRRQTLRARVASHGLQEERGFRVSRPGVDYMVRSGLCEQRFMACPIPRRNLLLSALQIPARRARSVLLPAGRSRRIHDRYGPCACSGQHCSPA